MSRLPQIRPLWWLVFLTGFFLVSVSFAFRFAREELAKVNRLGAIRNELSRMGTTSRKQLEALAATVEGQVANPETLFAEWKSKGQLQFSELKMTELPAGYRHHGVTLTIENLPVEELQLLLERAENARPAWRVMSIQLSSVGGGLQGQLLLEALDKSPPEL